MNNSRARKILSLVRSPGSGYPEDGPEIDSRLQKFWEINPIKFSDTPPEPMVKPCNAICTELLPFKPVLSVSTISHVTDQPGPSKFTTNILGYHQETLPMLDFTTHSNDSNVSYDIISGSVDDDTFININKRHHQAETEGLLQSESGNIGLPDDITLVLHKEPAEKPEILSPSDKNDFDSDETL